MNQVEFGESKHGRYVIINSTSDNSSVIMDYDVWLEDTKRLGVDEHTEGLYEILAEASNTDKDTVRFGHPKSWSEPRTVW